MKTAAYSHWVLCILVISVSVFSTGVNASESANVASSDGDTDVSRPGGRYDFEQAPELVAVVEIGDDRKCETSPSVATGVLR